MTEVDPAQSEQILTRLRRLEDERAIIDLVYAYADGLDGKHPEEFQACFTEDGRFAWRPAPDADWALDITGRDALERWYAEHERSIPAGQEHHVVTNPRVVALDGDSAHVITWYLVIRDFGGRPGVRSTGRYYDTLVRGEDDRWRIRERLALGDMPR